MNSPLNQCVILNIQNPNNHKISGFFSFGSIESYTSKITEHYQTPNMKNIFQSLYSNATELAKNTYQTVIPTSIQPTVVNSINSASNALKSAYDYVSYEKQKYVANLKGPTFPDNITDVPLLAGLPCQLNTSYYDNNNKQINFITPNIIIYISNGLNTYIYSVSETINNQITNKLSIFSFNGQLSSNTLPDYTQNLPYVISSGPINSYITYNYNGNLEYNKPITNGSFSKSPTENSLILSNIDSTKNDTIPFISLLHTIINNQSTSLNILNLDYSIACSLLILGVSIGPTQSIINYSLLSGTIPSGTSNYFFTLLQSSDIINSINNTKTYINIFKRYNTLLLDIQSEINNSYKNIPTDKNIQNAQLIIANAVSQSTILVNSPFITNNNTSLQISNTIITMGYNAVNYALLGDPNNNNLQSYYKTISQLGNPVILTAILNNAIYHVNNAVNNNLKSSSIHMYQNAHQSLKKALDIIYTDSALNSPTPHDSSYLTLINDAISSIKSGLISSPDNSDLLKANAILSLIESFVSGHPQIESLSSDMSYTPSNFNSSQYFNVTMGILSCIFFMVIIAFLINSSLTENDAQKIIDSDFSDVSRTSGTSDTD